MLSKKDRAKLVGERIILARKRKGMSQVALATALAERYGTDPESERRTLGNNERGSYEPRLHRLEAIAEATDQPLGFFAVEEDAGDVGQPFQPAAA